MTPQSAIALVDRLRRLPPAERAAILGQFNARELASLLYEWRSWWARPDQLPPGPEEPWTYLAFIGGRGSGKTRSCAEIVIERVREGKARKVHLLAATYDDGAETMVEGESGIIPCSPPEERPDFVKSRAGGLLFWPNGARGRLFSAEEAKRARGPQCDLLWADDIAAWGPHAVDLWDNAMYGFRKGDPKALISSTPMAMELLVSLIRDGRRNLVLRQSTTDHNANNLAAAFIDDVLSQYAGTQLEQQERFGRLLLDDDGAPFKATWIQRTITPPELTRIVVAVDPALTEEKWSDETGIVVLGLGTDGRLYVLADFSGKHTPEAWAKIVVWAHREYQADCVVAEVNAGRNLVRRNLEIEAPGLPIREVTTIRGKVLRFESLQLLYEKGLVSHVTDGPQISQPLTELPKALRGYTFRKRKGALTLEEETVGWIPAKSRSPNGLDALCHGAAELKPFDESLREHRKNPPYSDMKPEQRAGGSGVSMPWLRERSAGSSDWLRRGR